MENKLPQKKLARTGRSIYTARRSLPGRWAEKCCGNCVFMKACAAGGDILATITKVMSFENLLKNASLGKDTNGDGVVDGWRTFGSASATTSWLFDEEEPAQMINISEAADIANAAIEYEEYIPVTEGIEYTFSAFTKITGELPEGSGAQLIIMWFDEASPIGLMGADESDIYTNEEFIRHS